MKYQKKPVVIEAKRFDTTAMFEELSKLHEWVTGEYFKAIRSYRQERRYKYKVNGKKGFSGK